MSNQFYNKITSIILDYFREQDINSGDRYYLQFDKSSDVESLIEALKFQSDSKEFIYKHELGDEYKTFSMDINGVQLVIAFTTEEVKPDFLVTLRNQVGEQKDIWENTALFSVVSMQLDSIQGGSSDLQKEGMPLHPHSLINILKKEIDNSALNKVEQSILLEKMELIRQEESFQQITFFEFEDIFTALEKGYIDKYDYRLLGLFRDEDLDTYKGKQLKNRLELNRDLFEFVKNIHDFGLGEEGLDRKFSQNGKNKLKLENWSELNFSEVYKSYDEHRNQKHKTKIELKDLTLKDDMIIWNRPFKETSAGGRKRHIIIFNTKKKAEILLTATFNFDGGDVKSLSAKDVKTENTNVTYNVGRSNIHITIMPSNESLSFSRITYKHDGKPNLGVELNILILSMEPDLLDSFRSSYLIDPIKKLIVIKYEGNNLVFGIGSDEKNLEVFEFNQEFNFSYDEKITLEPLPDAFNDEDELQINIKLLEENILIPLLLTNEIPESIPILGARIWKMKRELSQDFILKSNKLTILNREFYLHPDNKMYFDWEKEWIDKSFKSAEFDSGALLNVDLELSDTLREAYSRFVNYFSSIESIPSLSYYSKSLRDRAEEYVLAYINEIKTFVPNKEAGKRGRDLFKLGVIYSKNCIYFTPFHPVIVATQLKLNLELENQEVENNILSRLRPDGLIPFIYNDDQRLFKPDPQNSALEWMIFKPVKQVSVSDANKYLAKVIEDKMSQFEEHFGYLLSDNSKAAVQINLINIENDSEVLRGIINWMLRVIDSKGIDALKSIELCLYRENDLESAFDLFSRTEAIDMIQSKFNINFSSSRQYDAQDLIRAIRSKLSYYKQSINDDYKYAHISFYKMMAQENDALQPMGDMLSGVALEGLYSVVPSMKSQEDYRIGFGVKAYTIELQNILTQTAYYFNELAANLQNSGFNTYRKGEAIFSRTTTADEETLDKIFRSSHWVTFIDSNIDLEFFNSYKNLVVIHYSDQYSTSSKYDAITVTDKSQQYYSVIEEFLIDKQVVTIEESIDNTVKAFNTFNGEWLLRIIGSKGHYSREKLSIISAIKFSLSYFDHYNILWVPISLEEILRVAGAVSLNKSEGVFTAKNLGVKGAHSDDLLLVGLEERDNDLFIHFYPIEVKIGINNSNVLEKAKIQVKQTKKLITDALSKTSEKKFTSKFYRYFFAQLFITNSAKLIHSQFWQEKENYILSESIIERLLKDQFKIAEHMDHIIGYGAVLSFQKDAYTRSSKLEDGVTYLNLTEDDGYNGLVRTMESMRSWIQDKENDFVKENMLSYMYNVKADDNIETNNIIVDHNVHNQKPGQIEHSKHIRTSELNNINESISEIQESDFIDESIHGESTDDSLNIVLSENVTVNLENEVKLEDYRILIGNAINSRKKIYWEYGNAGLANRHLLISGKSGQGKTYFMQCLLLEKVKLGISSIIVDYTEGFLPNQLESEFLEYLGPKFIQRIVYNERLPINPFRKNVRDIGGTILPESETDVAERVKSVFASVYKSLGIQQQNAIYEAVLEGLNRYSEDMSLPRLKELLEEDNSNYAKTALSQIRPLIDRNPFSDHESLEWQDILNNNEGKVYVIQLTGYPRDVQLIVTEFILWDLWNYSVRNGSKEKFIPVILDEAQNLDHTEKSPSAKILTEGRKFGWSGWYASQFLKSQLSADELARLQNASQKIYFAQPEQELSYIASGLSNDNVERKKWESQLSSLKKGQCIVYGPILKENGELSSPTITVVDVLPLSGRV